MTTRTRIASIDIVRGAVMVLMAIDHVRVYSGVPAGGPTAGVFFTRWVTHFCAPASADAPPALFRFLNQQKYPASPLFLLMTLGPTIALLPVAERMRGWFASMLETFGRVPMFYYLLHIPLIHATALLVWFIRDGTANDARFATAPFVSLPEGQRWGLPLLYLVFIITVAMLYVACRWFAGVKARRRGGWLRYL